MTACVAAHAQQACNCIIDDILCRNAFAVDVIVTPSSRCNIVVVLIEQHVHRRCTAVHAKMYWSGLS